MTATRPPRAGDEPFVIVPNGVSLALIKLVRAEIAAFEQDNDIEHLEQASKTMDVLRGYVVTP